jgi:hypothetical protein
MKNGRFLSNTFFSIPPESYQTLFDVATDLHSILHLVFVERFHGAKDNGEQQPQQHCPSPNSTNIF